MRCHIQAILKHRRAIDCSHIPVTILTSPTVSFLLFSFEVKSNVPADPSAMYGSPVLANAGVNPLYSPVSSVADPRSAAFFPAQSQYFYPSPSLMYSPANVPSPISGSQLLHGDGSKESAALVSIPDISMLRPETNYFSAANVWSRQLRVWLRRLC